MPPLVSMPKRSHHKKVPPQFPERAQFPAHAPKMLQRTKLSKRQHSRWAEQFVLFVAAQCGPDAAIALQEMLRRGSGEGLKIFLEVMGLKKNEAGVVLNLQQNYLNGGYANTGDRDINDLIRQLDERDRQARALPPAPHPAVESPIIEAEIVSE